MSVSVSVQAALSAAFPDGPPSRLGIAVSGGGDSTALLHLLADWATGTELHAITIDHGLRPEAQAEAEGVARHCAALGVAHVTVPWAWDRQGNLQDAARQARQRLIRAWAGEIGLQDVALGHTRDDQAETVLLRLARGSGVDGLAAMAPVRNSPGLRWLRPLLAVSRDALRDDLRTRGITWAEDPSNEDPRFDRIKARRALAHLAELGITAEGVAETAARMADAKSVLQEAARTLARHAAHREGGDICLNTAALRDAPRETAHRLMAHALQSVASTPYPPRRHAMEAAFARAQTGETLTLGGCLILGGPTLRIAREHAAVRTITAPLNTLWDTRWSITGPVNPTLTVKCLGEIGLQTCAAWRETGRPRAALLADPAVWNGENLVAAPTIQDISPYRAHFRPSCDEFIP